MQSAYIGLPSRRILDLIEEEVLLAACEFRIELRVRVHDQIELSRFDGHQAVVLEIEDNHLPPIDAAGFESTHSVVENEGLATAADAHERCDFACVERQFQLARYRCREFPGRILREDIFEAF